MLDEGDKVLLESQKPRGADLRDINGGLLQGGYRRRGCGQPPILKSVITCRINILIAGGGSQ